VDRFLIKLSTGYVSHKGFVKMSKSIREIEKAIEGLKPVIGGQQLVDGMERVENVKVDDSVLDCIASIVEESRVHPAVRLGGSPMAGIAIVRLSKAWTYIEGRDYTIPDDVKAVAKPALSHRIQTPLNPVIAS